MLDGGETHSFARFSLPVASNARVGKNQRQRLEALLDPVSNLSFDTLIQTLTTMGTEFGLKALGAVAVLLLGIWVARWLRGMLRTYLGATRVDPTLVPFISSLVYWAMVVFVIIAVLGVFGVPTAQFVAVLGAAGLAVGLALQGTLSNFAAGVMLLIFRPFSVGHWVEIGGSSGSVQEIGVFSTVLHTGDNIRVVVPNAQVFGQTIRNFSANPTRRVDLVIGVSYSDDLQVAQETLERVLASDERILPEPEPRVAVHNLGDSSVDFVVRPWCRTPDYWPLRWDLTRRIKEALEAAGCSIPFPQRDLHLYPVGGSPAPGLPAVERVAPGPAGSGAATSGAVSPGAVSPGAVSPGAAD
jgi:small conductance mechanosensitive channel